MLSVKVKDNETLVSYVDFIETTNAIVKEIFRGKEVLRLNIKSPVQSGQKHQRASNKALNELLKHVKTLYYKRMAFVIEIPSIHGHIDGNTLSLCGGGDKAYNLDNLYKRS